MNDDDFTAKAKRLYWWAAVIVGLLVSVAAYASQNEHRLTVLEVQFQNIDQKLNLLLEAHGLACDKDHEGR